MMINPDIKKAQETLPPPLFEVLKMIFAEKIPDCVLVGGMALSGFYTGHRRSDDLDIFVKDEFSFKSLIQKVKALSCDGVELQNERRSAHYWHATAKFKNHIFTIDVVLDSNFFAVGKIQFADQDQRIAIASLETILKMKSAALVSRASEKDLSDLMVLSTLFMEVEIGEFINKGREIDAGVNAESMLASVVGAQLREEACDFSLDGKSAEVVHKEILDFRKRLSLLLRDYLKEQPLPPIGELIKKGKKVLR